MQEAMLYELLDHDKKIVRCGLCSHHCRIKPRARGRCGVRENHDGRLFSLVYGRIIAEHVDPIEKKPLFHVLPGSRSYSIATVGCNFHCLHCQNYDISQYSHLHGGEITGASRSPEQIIAGAKMSSCASISYTYVEPTIFFEFALETARLAHGHGIKNIFVSNGYTSPAATREIAPYLDANNIDLKAFTEEFYHKVCGAKLAPVLDTIILMKSLGVWVEITTLIIPGWNDTEQELRNIATFIKGVDPAMPWHVTRFHPTYQMTDRPPTPLATLNRARKIGLEAGLLYVYEGNVAGQGGENTYCHACGKLLIERLGFQLAENNLHEGKCSFCQTPVAGLFR